MPTLSAIQLDRFLEPGATAKTTTFKKNKEKVLEEEDEFPKLQRRNTTSLIPDDIDFSSSRRSVDVPPPYPNLRRRNSAVNSPRFSKTPVRTHISPALYTTPEPTPLPLSPTSSFPPSSPFLINHKRRGPRFSKSFSEQNVAENMADVGRTRSLSEENVSLERIEDEVDEAVDKVNGDVTAVVTVEGENDGGNGGIVEVGDGGKKQSSGVSSERELGDGEDFFDPQESMSFSSSIDMEDYGAERSAKVTTPMGEFYDAWEELSSDSGRQSASRSLSDVETELREMRLTLLMEIEKRKHVEESLQNMQSQWQMLRQKVATAGVDLPADLAVEEGQSDESITDDICRQIHLVRFVSESIGRGTAKAEVEAEMEAQLEAKNFEIARLCDRLHYYETMNREMSQRNQEAVEIARRERQKRRRRQKWVWGSIATAVTLGTAALAWSYFPGGKGSSATKPAQVSKPDTDVQ
ncbi:hypothetical protein RND81_13G184300 [Saponaria officinalis]|uniref:Netrin receptor DCC n=1 Tax=Saponaria officinalis TaxID=3572 RepID=A0AAW1H3Z4_SAPOF